MSTKEIINQLNTLDPEKGLQFINSLFGSGAKISSALGKEDQVLTHWVAHHDLDIEVFTLDTGRLFQESYDLLDLTRQKYKIPIKVYFPDHDEVEDLVSKKGMNSFYESIENRKECCTIRKVKPLKRALTNTSVWITGIRAEQSANRKSMKLAEWDEDFQLIKYNPLLDLSTSEMDRLINENNIPVSSLHKKGYPSIGCLPCTRAIMKGEDPRAGRWWWENSSKECGLHQTKVTFKKKVYSTKASRNLK